MSSPSPRGGRRRLPPRHVEEARGLPAAPARAHAHRHAADRRVPLRGGLWPANGRVLCAEPGQDGPGADAPPQHIPAHPPGPPPRRLQPRRAHPAPGALRARVRLAQDAPPHPRPARNIPRLPLPRHRNVPAQRHHHRRRRQRPRVHAHGHRGRQDVRLPAVLHHRRLRVPVLLHARLLDGAHGVPDAGLLAARPLLRPGDWLCLCVPIPPPAGALRVADGQGGAEAVVHLQQGAALCGAGQQGGAGVLGVYAHGGQLQEREGRGADAGRGAERYGGGLCGAWDQVGELGGVGGV